MPSAEVVADRFHVMKQINQELDEQRKAEKRAVEAQKNKKQKAILHIGAAPQHRAYRRQARTSPIPMGQ